MTQNVAGGTSSLNKGPALYLHVPALTNYAAHADFCDDDVALSPPQKVNAHVPLPDLLQRAPRAVFRRLTSFSLVLVDCVCCLLCRRRLKQRNTRDSPHVTIRALFGRDAVIWPLWSYAAQICFSYLRTSIPIVLNVLIPTIVGAVLFVKYNTNDSWSG